MASRWSSPRASIRCGAVLASDSAAAMAAGLAEMSARRCSPDHRCGTTHGRDRGDTRRLRRHVRACLRSRSGSGGGRRMSDADATIARLVALAEPIAGTLALADGRIWHAAGASEAQELAAVLATVIELLASVRGERHGARRCRVADRVALAADTDQFLTIAKFRAMRLLLARALEAAGIAAIPPIHAETAWRTMSRREPRMNVLRATGAAFAAAVGGADFDHRASFRCAGGHVRRRCAAAGAQHADSSSPKRRSSTASPTPPPVRAPWRASPTLSRRRHGRASRRSKRKAASSTSLADRRAPGARSPRHARRASPARPPVPSKWSASTSSSADDGEPQPAYDRKPERQPKGACLQAAGGDGGVAQHEPAAGLHQT